ncbi:hypothetical protein GII36_04440 [Candidatus Mycosynbacter amalyticus]|uniref:Uncharacterized protein n=1 Tax=Candidatus Mycosynbacter amalyticus TaxID=2665156 RepID=A0A857MLU7_9BACT|nr:hypothetical protein [Candidatus Mycosynbacter amalyticus]QHN43078.1 hypothetical protein GII36_04440 [Candidatus Mycosynbacter amalyticus]
MSPASDIDTIEMGYEETAYTSRQALDSHTLEQPRERAEVQDALSLATMLKQLREHKLHGSGDVQTYA